MCSRERMYVSGIEQSTDVKQIVFPRCYREVISVEINVKPLLHHYSFTHAPPCLHYAQGFYLKYQTYCNFTFLFANYSMPELEE